MIYHILVAQIRNSISIATITKLERLETRCEHKLTLIVSNIYRYWLILETLGCILNLRQTRNFELMSNQQSGKFFYLTCLF